LWQRTAVLLNLHWFITTIYNKPWNRKINHEFFLLASSDPFYIDLLEEAKSWSQRDSGYSMAVILSQTALELCALSHNIRKSHHCSCTEKANPIIVG